MSHFVLEHSMAIVVTCIVLWGVGQIALFFFLWFNWFRDRGDE